MLWPQSLETTYLRIAIVRHMSYMYSIGIVSHQKDTVSYVLDFFPNWRLVRLINEIFFNQLYQLCQLCLKGQIAVTPPYFLANDSREKFMGTGDNIVIVLSLNTYMYISNQVYSPKIQCLGNHSHLD